MSEWIPLVEADPMAEKDMHPGLKKMLDENPTAKKLLDSSKIWLNDVYQVAVRVMGPDEDGGELIHLSIKRRDREPCKDWRDFQRIKNQLCGEEAEGVELYPAESRIVDTANQYHIWVFTKSKIGLGFPAGMKATTKEAENIGAKQRQRDDE